MAGQTIMKQGDKFSEVYLVLEGELESNFTIDDIQVKLFFSEGFFFGAVDILSNKLCCFNFLASTNVKLLVIEGV